MDARKSNGVVRKLIENVYVVSAVRTPMGGYRKSLKSCSPVFLGAVACREAIRKAGISADDIDETIVGCVLTACHGQNIARQISISAGVPVTSPSVTVNKVCSSGLKAIIMAAQAVQLGYRDAVLAAGTESMSNAYYGTPRTDSTAMSNPIIVDSMLEDGLSDAFSKLKMGICAEKTAAQCSITRLEQDQYALESYRRAQEAWKSGLFDEEVVPIMCPDSNEVFEDDEYKKLNTLKVPHLKPAFIPDTGTITAANASTISDGAAALVVAGDNFLARRRTSKPMAQILGYSEVGVEPTDFTRAPAVAAKKLLAKIGLSADDISLWEVNEAFAATAIVFLRDMGLESDCVNVRGGAVALGHPIGASGARIVVTLLHALQAGQIGIATLCNGGGEATAIALKRL